jgi:hypothetical protein
VRAFTPSPVLAASGAGLDRPSRARSAATRSAAWKLALQRSRASGKPPTRADVPAAVEVADAPQARDRQPLRLVQRNRALKVGIAVEALTPEFRGRLGAANTVPTPLAALRSETLENAAPNDPKEGGD